MIGPARKLYLIGGGFILGIAAILLLAALPLLEFIKTDSGELSQKKQAVATLYQNWQEIENSKLEYGKIQAELKERTALLSSQEAIEFIQAVENAAQATQNSETISIYSPTPKKDSKDQKTDKTIEFRVALEGTFPSLIKFLTHLENAPYYNNINSLQIRLAKKNANNPDDGSQTASGEIESTIILSVFQQ